MAYLDVAKLTHIRFMCHKVMPAVYDESLSYLEGLAKLTFKLNETIDNVNALDDNVEYLNDVVIDVDARVTTMEHTLDTFLTEIEKEFAELMVEFNKEIDDKLAEVDAEMAEIDERVSAIEDSLDAKFAEFEAKVNALIRDLTNLVNAELKIIRDMYTLFEAEMKAYVEEEIQKALEQIPDLTNIYVIDPSTGKLSKVQDAINNIFDFNLCNAFTIDEINELGMTINQMNSIMVKSIPRGLTVKEWLHDAKKILLTQVEPNNAEKFAYPHTFVFDYLRGIKVWHDKNADLNNQLISVAGCYSCDELNELAFTCDEVNAFNITCADYNLKGNMIMVR